MLAHPSNRLKAGHSLTLLQRWVLDLEPRVGHNKATVELANKLARIVWVCWKYERDFNGDYALAA